MSAVVLGGTGFVGRHVCEAFRAAGFSVLPLSRTTTVPVDLTTVAGARALGGLLADERPDVIVNAAGSVWRVDEKQLMDGNVTLVDRLLRTLVALPHPPRLIQLGTVHEYGWGTIGQNFTEDDPPAPVLPYGRSKLLGTETVLRAVRDAGLDALVLRVGHASGPGAPAGSLLGAVRDHLVAAGAAAETAVGTAAGTAVGTAVKAAVRAALPPLRLASLRSWCDFVDVRDVADAVVAAAVAPADAVRGHVVNVGRGEAVEVRGVVQRMVALSHLPVPVIETDPSTEASWQRLDITKARDILAWRPRRTLDESLRALLDTV